MIKRFRNPHNHVAGLWSYSAPGALAFVALSIVVGSIVVGFSTTP